MGEYAVEKGNMQKLLTGARMVEYCYGEIFSLRFQQGSMTFALRVDAPCWFGEKSDWLERADVPIIGMGRSEREDCLLAYELTRLRYYNLIEVEKVDFLKEHVEITFSKGNVLAIVYDALSEADYNEAYEYEWYLEEMSPQKGSGQIVVGCSGGVFFQKNIGELCLLWVRDRLWLGSTYCVSVEGEVWRLQNGLELTDENGNHYVVETVGMSHYQEIESYQGKAELVLRGDVAHIGGRLYLAE